jgi:hypothetical protein
MSNKIVLPVSGASVTLKAVSSFKQKEREAIYKGTEEITNKALGGWQIVKNTLSILIEDWDLELPIPRLDPNSLGELEVADFETLQKHCEDALKLLWPDLSESIESKADPKADTANSND